MSASTTDTVDSRYPYRHTDRIDLEPSLRHVIHLTTVDMSLRYLLLPQLVAMRDAGWRVTGVSAAGEHVEALREHGIEHIALEGSTRAADARGDLRAARHLRRILQQVEPDVLHTHNPKPGVYGRILGRLCQVPAVVNTVHGLYALPEDPLLKRALVYGAERVAATCSDLELVQSREDVETLASLGVPRERLRHLGNGVDLSRFDPDRDDLPSRDEVRASLGLEESDLVVGTVGRLVAEKGYPELFEGFRRARAQQPQLRLVVVGPHDPDKADALDPALVDRAAADGVQFLGMRDDVEVLYRAFDLYVLASHREGFPRSAMEAAAMRLPVFATDIRGCREVVEHGRTGELFAVRDPAAIAEALVLAARDGNRLQELAEGARRKALAEFDDRRQVEITLQAYEDVLA